MIQPRLGLSWDVTGEGKTIVHGGWGKYYDRTLFNDILDEKYRTQYNSSEFWFSKDGSPQDGRPAIKWNPAYLDRGRPPAAPRAAESPGSPRSISSTTTPEPPSSDQWSLGLRHELRLVQRLRRLHGRPQQRTS